MAIISTLQLYNNHLCYYFVANNYNFSNIVTNNNIVSNIIMHHFKTVVMQVFLEFKSIFVISIDSNVFFSSVFNSKQNSKIQGTATSTHLWITHVEHTFNKYCPK